jgi:hypothetical protein
LLLLSLLLLPADSPTGHPRWGCQSPSQTS